MKRVGPFVLIGVAVVLVGLVAVLRTGRPTAGSDSPPVTVRAADYDLAGAVLADPWPRPSFTLTATDGRRYDFAAETAGRLTLLFFGYTSCPDICPIHLATLADVLARPGMPRPAVVFVGIDPKRDTPDAVRAFLDRFDADFIGLTGTPSELEAAQVATGVPVAFAEPADEGGDYLVGHASQIVAYTPDDLAHVVYPFGIRQQDWVHDLPRLTSVDWTPHEP